MSWSAARGGLQGTVTRSPRTARAGAVLVLALLALLPTAAPAAAHDDLVGSTPRQSQELAALPAQVELEFDQPALPGYSAVALTAPDGTDLRAGDVTEDDVFVRVPVDPAPVAGEYVMAYRVVASDGHPVSGEITFTVTGPTAADTGSGGSPSSPPATSPVTPTATPTQSPSPAAPTAAAAGAGAGTDGAGASPGLLAALAAAVVLGGAAAAVLLRRRRSSGNTG